MKHFPVNKWAEEDRPREKLRSKGRKALTDAELLAILLGSGSRNETVLELAQRILRDHNNNLDILSRLSIDQLMQYKGIGEAKAITVIAALELGNRIRTFKASLQKITSSKTAFEYLHGILGQNNHEEFHILLLNRSNHVIRPVKISEGGFSGTLVDPKKIFKIALENAASSIILSHNHPSGNIQPSQEDIRLTKRIVDAGKILTLEVLDHIIIGGNNYYSFADAGEIVR